MAYELALKQIEPVTRQGRTDRRGDVLTSAFQWEETVADTIHDLQDTRVRNIAANLPGASAVFRRFAIELCCHGHIPLIDADTHRNINLTEVHKALAGFELKAHHDAPRDTYDLIEHIHLETNVPFPRFEATPGT
ncbi:DUF542 domain-containing protein [Marivita sp. S2033]|uniref:DUF542 domain-containing protein n=1 Tax=Marivita sp. S2033 TaxID=3373187 RepID=UPI003982CE6F